MGQRRVTLSPPTPPTPPWCRGATEELRTLGEVCAPCALPWPGRVLPERSVRTGAAPDLREDPPHCRSHRPSLLRGGGARRAQAPPILISVRCCAPPAAGTREGCPSWCREQECRTPRCPLHDLHAGARCASHWVCMGRC